MRHFNGTVTSFTPRTADQVRADTGTSVRTLARHAVNVATTRWGGTDAVSASHTYDVDYGTMQRALDALVRNGYAVRGTDPVTGEMIYSRAQATAKMGG